MNTANLSQLQASNSNQASIANYDHGVNVLSESIIRRLSCTEAPLSGIMNNNGSCQSQLPTMLNTSMSLQRFAMSDAHDSHGDNDLGYMSPNMRSACIKRNAFLKHNFYEQKPNLLQGTSWAGYSLLRLA